MTNIDYSLEERREAKYNEQCFVSVETYIKHPGKLISASDLHELLFVNTENRENISCKITWQEDP